MLRTWIRGWSWGIANVKILWNHMNGIWWIDCDGSNCACSIDGNVSCQSRWPTMYKRAVRLAVDWNPVMFCIAIDHNLEWSITFDWTTIVNFLTSPASHFVKVVTNNAVLRINAGVKHHVVQWVRTLKINGIRSILKVYLNPENFSFLV